MIRTLAERTRTPYRGGIPPLSIDAARRYQDHAPAWNLLEDGGLLQRTFRFANFREALDFASHEKDQRAPEERHQHERSSAVHAAS